MASIGDVILRLLLEDKGFEAEVVKAGEKAGDKAGLTMGQRMSKGLTAGMTVLGAAGGALFGIAIRGANELTNAMAGFRAETGATQEEVESARKSVLELSKSNLQSFEEIARTQAKLRTDLGLTQEEAEKATDAFLKYGTATGRDAAEGVASLDDILDAWNLDSSKSGEIMDKLVASHQKYGGSISENEAALKNLAPQLQALNLDYDKGIGLLNLFAEGGLDASKAQFALNSAIQKLPEGQTLEQFVAHLASIEDPAERARQAIQVFGARGGAGLANVIRPGMKGLGDFTISMGEAAGATNEAAEAIENTPFNQLKMALRGIAAPAIEAGQAFGPLILALSQLGGGKLVTAATTALGSVTGFLASKLLKPFGKLGVKLGERLATSLGAAIAGNIASDAIADGVAGSLDAVPRSSKVSGAMGRVGKFLGSGIGKAFGLAFGVVAAAAIASELEDDVQGLAEDVHSKLNDLELPLPDVDWKSLTEAPWPIGNGPALWDPQKIKDGAAIIPANITTALEYGQSEVDVAARTMMQSVPGEVDAAAVAAGEAAGDIPQSIAQGILDQQNVVKQGMSALTSQMDSELSRTAEIAYLVGVLTSKSLAKGLNDERPGVRAIAEQTRSDAEARLAELVPQGSGIGTRANEALADGLDSKNPEVKAAAKRTQKVIDGELTKVPPAAKKDGAQTNTSMANGMNSKLPSVRTAATRIKTTVRAQTNLGNEARRWGRSTGLAYSTGLRSTIEAIQTAARLAAGAVRGALRADSPPVVTSPLHFIDKWGERTMEAYAGGLEKGGGRAEAVLHRLLGGPRGFTVPIQASGVISGASSYQADAVAGGGVTYNYNMPVQGALPVRTPADAVAAMRRINEHGELPPKFLSPQYPRRESGVRP